MEHTWREGKRGISIGKRRKARLMQISSKQISISINIAMHVLYVGITGIKQN